MQNVFHWCINMDLKYTEKSTYLQRSNNGEIQDFFSYQLNTDYLKKLTDKYIVTIYQSMTKKNKNKCPTRYCLKCQRWR